MGTDAWKLGISVISVFQIQNCAGGYMGLGRYPAVYSQTLRQMEERSSQYD